MNRTRRNDGAVSRDDSIAEIMGQLNKLTDEALEYLSHWSMPFGVLPILRDYEDGKLMRDCDHEALSLLDREACDMALEAACRFIAGYGSCPYDVFDFRAKDCYEECDDSYADCWRRYFERGGSI